MGLLGSLSYARKVSRLASSLGKTERLLGEGRFDVVANNLWDDSTEDDAKEALFKLLQGAPMISAILKQHSVGVDTLRDLYDVLARIMREGST